MKYLTTLIVVILITGCCPQGKQCQSQIDPLELSAKEIADVLQMQKWSIQVPKDLADDERIELRLAHEDMDRVLSTIPALPGELSTVIIWRNYQIDEQDFYFKAYSSKSGTGGKLLKRDTPKIATNSIGENTDHICSIGETLMSGMVDKSDHPYRIYTAVGEK